MGMKIEAIGITHYTINLTDEDVGKVKKWIQEHWEELLILDMERSMCEAVLQLSSEGEIELYDDNKAIESDFYTD